MLRYLVPKCCDRLSPGLTIATFQRNLSQHCWAQHVACVWPPCSDVLRCVTTCWVLLAQIWNGLIFGATSEDVAWCCNRLARFVQQCCAWACALIWFSSHNVEHVATGWPNARNMLRPTMLRSFGRGQQCWDMLCWYVAIVLAVAPFKNKNLNFQLARDEVVLAPWNHGKCMSVMSQPAQFFLWSWEV